MKCLPGPGGITSGLSRDSKYLILMFLNIGDKAIAVKNLVAL